MPDLEMVVTSLQSKIEKLVHLHKKLEDDNIKLVIENQQLAQEVDRHIGLVRIIEDENRSLLLASANGGFKNIGSATESKEKINELVREIDKCIALLNK